MKLISWNVNGLRAILSKGFLDFIEQERPDILCLQETKANGFQIATAGYLQYWSHAEKKGYAGTAVFAREQPLQVFYGLGKHEHDREGRVIACEFEHFMLVNVYTPNAGRGLERLDYRTQEWDVAFLDYLQTLEAKKPVAFCGDLNVAHQEIDLANPQQNQRNAGFTIQERRGFDRLVEAGFIDTFRQITQEGGHYTWWSNFNRARQRNIGWRIDYFYISARLRNRLQRSEILPQVLGSDHCPIRMELG